MNCQQLAAAIELIEPSAQPRDVARLCLLLINGVDDVEKLASESCLNNAWQEVGLRLQAASDQHAAMTEELERLVRSDPEAFTVEQVWILIRAIRVQSQILQMYLGQTAAGV
jgi:hypothetical protein